MSTVWPKRLKPLTPEQLRIKNEWESYWLSEGMTRYSFVEKFNANFFASLKDASPPGQRILEIGPGKGNFIRNYLQPGDKYFVVERRQDFCNELSAHLEPGHAVCADIQQGVPLPDGSFDRIIAVHVLEHLPDLPRALTEINRLLQPAGHLDIVIPCEGALIYSAGRKFSSERVFKKKFKCDFKPIISSDHVNTAKEVLTEVYRQFHVEVKRFFPLGILPVVDCNLLIGLRASKR